MANPNSGWLPMYSVQLGPTAAMDTIYESDDSETKAMMARVPGTYTLTILQLMVRGTMASNGTMFSHLILGGCMAPWPWPCLCFISSWAPYSTHVPRYERHQTMSHLLASITHMLQFLQSPSPPCFVDPAKILPRNLAAAQKYACLTSPYVNIHHRSWSYVGRRFDLWAEDLSVLHKLRS